MALSNATITYDLSDQVGVDFDARRTKVWVTTNVPGDTIVDTVGNKIRLGDGLGTIAEDGTGSVSVWAPGTGSNPASWQTTIHVDYAQRRPGATRVQKSFGPYTVSGDADLSDLIVEQEVPPTYLGAAVATLDALVDQAEAAAAAAVSISGISTSDGVVEALVKGTAGAGPLTRAALLSSLASYLNLAKNPDAIVTGAVTLDGSDQVTTAAVKWPDGSPGTLTITSRHATGAVLAYNVTYGSPVTKTYTQPAITRNTNGAATNVPAIVVT